MKKPTQSLIVHSFKKGQITQREDLLATEEPLEIRIQYQTITKNIAVTMRTPGYDFELAAGFLLTEGIITSNAQIDSIDYIKARKKASLGNIVLVKLVGEVIINLKKLERNFYVSSSCGVCGKGSIEAVQTCEGQHFIEASWVIESSVLLGLPARLREAQAIFEQTGGLHAAAIFGLDGQLQILKEDVGRHNALDKVIGAALLNEGLPFGKHILLVSGRASFELVQKAAMAGIGMLVAVGAPSSLAVELADEMGITLVGFLKSERFNCYTHPQRIKLKPSTLS